ncbi:putative iron-regulated protein [Hoeflea sp. IMCC20628]|uniref:imelysin family protein n=1 Tax=Hoeflea sp. IMCC20628 TaxID=1620421 RepID=UPI00063B0840|nr:imelysin family protein [Hoeflea sp. IMCC20628]AKI02192.1 putative iron-regulated protein [Hoeflea sp. IMCC20628]
MKNFAHLLGIGLLASTALTTAAVADVTPEAVVAHYADIAEAKFDDALMTAKDLDAAIEAFLANPDDITLEAAKEAWLASRVPYQQTEVYRFGNAIVDDWEGRVNAWPLDEGLIDYVDESYGAESDQNSLYSANVIANPSIKINGKTVDASKITPELISETLQEAGGIEANVASGYHAIEFLLWGQDLNGNGPGAGNRPATDYSLEYCTNGHCDRRRDYLGSASDLLVADLEEMAANWKAGGAARTALEEKGAAGGLSTILTGMGSLSYGELAGERMKLGLLLGDPEEEHDCFSDNTHNSHRYDAVGIQTAYTGTYTRPDGSELAGPSLADLVEAKDPAIAGELSADLDTTVAAMEAMVDRAENVEAYDQMIATGNDEGNATVQAAIDGLIKQTRSIERAITALDLGTIELEGSDSLDSPDAVFQ